MKKTKILIHGLGGVGGYYAGKLAKTYATDPHIDIYFIARNEHLAQIRTAGLHFISDTEDFFAHPTLATDTPADIGVVDYIIVATKGYDLTSSIEQLAPCIDKDTVILPLLNGGDITERIREVVPQAIVWSGCSYVVSRRRSPGVIKSVGDFSKLVFGYDKGSNEQTRYMEQLLIEADIDARLREPIKNAIWQKFFFISSAASLTSYYDTDLNDLVSDQHIAFTKAFATEFLQVADAESVIIGENPIEKLVSNLSRLPQGATSSMCSDFRNHHRTEVDLLTGVVVDLAHKHNLSVPKYEKVYATLKSRSQ